MKHVPGWVLAVIVAALTVTFLGIMGSLVYLSGKNADTTVVMQFINTAFNFALLILTGTGAAAATAAAKSAAAAEKQTNGELGPRIVESVHTAMDERENGNGGGTNGRPAV